MKRNANTSRGGDKTPINEEIRAREVRLVGADGEMIGIVSINEALSKAGEADQDLVLIAADAEPPVCKIMDHGKHLFEKKKQQAVAKKKQKQTQIKEMKFRPGTEEGDYQVKLRNLVRFLEEGDKAKVSLRFRGREMAHQEIGMQLMNRLEKDLDELAVVEQRAKMEGRQMVMVMAPKKKK
ncbi:translation initiation factor IF-3 [Pokkaliibacter sp. CJK22405]|uniref:translation initiation factor IF-3 n=1 Tax=Pokkaliibacter sp. CJK22405 TaxID=3384615 RepID=UPI0039847E7B